MPRSKEIPETLRKQVVEAHGSGKGYNQISKALGLSKATVRSILHKWRRFGTVVTLPRSGRPPKISVSTREEIIRKVKKNPCTTSRDLQAALASANICVHHSTIRRILGIHGRPTLSSLEDSVAQTEKDGNQEASEKLASSDGLNHNVKVEVDQPELDNYTDPVGGGGGSMEEEHFKETETVNQDGDGCHDNGGDGSEDTSSEKYIAVKNDSDSDSSADDMVYKYDDSDSSVDDMVYKYDDSDSSVDDMIYKYDDDRN